MPYLFDREIEAAINKNVHDATELRTTCDNATTHLLPLHPNPHTYAANDATAEQLAISMGSKSRKDRDVPATNPHALDYVSGWTALSDNAQHIVGMVCGELPHAYQLGLDIRSHVVIGTIYKLAVKVWSTIGQYTGPAQDEGRR
ncbi:hypothetical protein [Lysobacter sp. CFH 32150]|uniref:hypothetical protein n=1 Tax=Lysobacter sp. CFH 32150 TaxID=2927128 RepID=UPI001FA72740|nr:hypothetical protein [Lysobacter sp. CFH 32150]MCI4568481.1 hypothetical protein [Lysobacter sp. CFH 32150]